MSKLLRLSTAVVALALVGLVGCIPALKDPGDATKIRLVSSTTSGGWTYDYYRNTAYPCAVSGYQTFTVATKVGSSATATRPLWVKMHGGGVGYFSPTTGAAMPNDKQKVEEGPAAQRSQIDGIVIDKVRADASGFRLMSVSMCDHDLYGGPNIADPNNPGTIPGGQPRTVNGLYATKAAIQFVQAKYPTDDFFLHGGSAGSVGSYNVGWSLQQQGLAPTGIVADSGVLNIQWQDAQADDPECGRTDEALTEIPKRLHPDLVDPANQPDRLVATGRLTVPLIDVYSTNDPNPCGNQPMACPLPDGSHPTMGSADCMHAPIRLAIAGQGRRSKSLSMRLCVSPAGKSGTCDVHTSTMKTGLTNTLAPWPADYSAPIIDWVHARQSDD
ncbi:hypothetical protein BH10ACT1_BH10ACT1_12710 [soil metagenome]